MHVTPLCELEIHYTDLEFVDFGVGGQYYGHLEGHLRGGLLSGTVRLVNLAAKRPDDTNLPTLRGTLVTEDGAKVFISMDGIALMRAEDGARVFSGATAFRTGDPRYTWLNTLFAIMEGVLLPSMVAQVRVHRCEPTIGSPTDDSEKRAGAAATP